MSKRSKNSFERGVGTVYLDDWNAFISYIHTKMVDQPDFVWRGQRSQAWPLRSGLERDLSALGVGLESIEATTRRFNHLRRFKLSARGRLDARDFEERDTYGESYESEVGPGDVLIGPSAAEREENNWWAVGQHYGLKTPLLDWSTSPFVAAYFAFSNATPEGNSSDGRAIYGLNRTLVSQRADALRQEAADDGFDSIAVIDFIEPLYKDNPRLVSQGGLFTRTPDGKNVEDWVSEYYSDKHDNVWLVKLVLPDENRDYILRSLNRMNINHQSLFPDLYGVTEFVNMKLTLEDY